MRLTVSGRGFRPLVSGFVLLLLVACASLPGATVQQPVQSPNDDYGYRYLTLANDMQVLLISDPGAPKAAAALDVQVGSGDNPPGREGLAHFLEHMLFLGTDKYPDAAEYEQFITEHGGSRNAYTSFEHTNYFFDIQAEHLGAGPVRPVFYRAALRCAVCGAREKRRGGRIPDGAHQ